MDVWGRFALATQDTKSLLSKFRTRAETRALIGALLVGAGLGLAAGAAYLIDLNARAAADKARVARLTSAALQGYDAVSSAPAPVAAPTPLAAIPSMSPRVAAVSTAPRRSTGDLDCLATAVYYEARGETRAGQEAVAQVVLNRSRHPAWPKSVCAVVYQGVGHGCQFSFTCNGAMKHPREPQAWAKARDVAARALSGYVMVAVGEATAFHAAHNDGSAPSYGRGSVKLGGQVFYVASANANTGRSSASASRREEPTVRAPDGEQRRMTFALGMLMPVSSTPPKSGQVTAEAASAPVSSTPS